VQINGSRSHLAPRCASATSSPRLPARQGGLGNSGARRNASVAPEAPPADAEPLAPTPPKEDGSPCVDARRAPDENERGRWIACEAGTTSARVRGYCGRRWRRWRGFLTESGHWCGAAGASGGAAGSGAAGGAVGLGGSTAGGGGGGGGAVAAVAAGVAAVAAESGARWDGEKPRRGRPIGSLHRLAARGATAPLRSRRGGRERACVSEEAKACLAAAAE